MDNNVNISIQFLKIVLKPTNIMCIRIVCFDNYVACVFSVQNGGLNQAS